MEYLTLPLTGGVDSEGQIFFKANYDNKILTFNEMYDNYGLSLVTIVPINAIEANWKGSAVFSRIKPGTLQA